MVWILRILIWHTILRILSKGFSKSFSEDFAEPCIWLHSHAWWHYILDYISSISYYIVSITDCVIVITFWITGTDSSFWNMLEDLRLWAVAVVISRKGQDQVRVRARAECFRHSLVPCPESLHTVHTITILYRPYFLLILNPTHESQPNQTLSLLSRDL